MANLTNTTKHIALVRTSIPKRDADNPAKEANAWFCVELTNGDILFHVEKKKGGPPQRFKNGAMICKYLDKLGVLDDKYKDGQKANKYVVGGKVVAGKMWRERGDLKLSCDIKAKGGGKATLKAALKRTKKIGLEAGMVEIVKAAGSVKEDEDVDKALNIDDGSWLEMKSAEDPNLLKWAKLHTKILKGVEKATATTPSTENYGVIEDLRRRIAKYDNKITAKYLKKCSKDDTFARNLKKSLGDDPKTPAWFQSQLNDLETKFKAVMEAADSKGAEDGTSAGTAEAGDGATKNALKIAEYAAQLEMSDTDLEGFAEIAEIHMPMVDALFNTFKINEIQQLYRAVGGEDWANLFMQLSAMERA